jgi:hypothetical protein
MKFRNDVDRMLVPEGAIEHAKYEMDVATVSKAPVALERSAAQPDAKIIPLRRAGDFPVDDLMCELNDLVVKYAPVIPAMDEMDFKRPEYQEYEFTEEDFHRNMAKIKKSVVDVPSAPSDEDLAHITTDVRTQVQAAEKAGLAHLAMTPEQITQTVRKWVQERKHKRRDKEPALEMLRDMLRAHFAERTEKPEVAEIMAATATFAMQGASKQDLDDLRAHIAGPHHMLQVLKRVNRADVWETRAYQKALAQFQAAWAEKEVDLALQRRKAYAAKMRVVESNVMPPPDSVYEQVQAELIADGVHEVFAEIEMENARGYFELFSAPE